MEQITFGAVIELVSGLGTIGVLLWLTYMFQRGDLISRRVYEELTTRILEELSDKIVEKIQALLEKDNA